MNETCGDAATIERPDSHRFELRPALGASNEIGDVEAWARAETRKLLRVAKLYLRDEHDAEQVVREVMLSALHAVSAGEPDAASQTWLRERTLARTLEKLRDRPRPVDSGIEHMLPRFRADGSRASEPAAHGPSDDEEIVAAMRRHIDRLPELHRAVYLLKTVERLDLRSISEHLMLSDAAVRRLLHEARLSLCTLLAPQRRGRGRERGRGRGPGVERMERRLDLRGVTASADARPRPARR